MSSSCVAKHRFASVLTINLSTSNYVPRRVVAGLGYATFFPFKCFPTITSRNRGKFKTGRHDSKWLRQTKSRFNSHKSNPDCDQAHGLHVCDYVKRNVNHTNQQFQQSLSPIGESKFLLFSDGMAISVTVLK